MSAPHPSLRLQALSESLTLAVDVKVQELTARGADIVNLSAGQPDFPTPPEICRAAAEAVEAGATRYTPPAGTRELRAEVARFFSERFGVPATAETTVVCAGAKHALYNAMIAVLEPGDEVLIPAPYWVSYPDQVKLAEGIPVAVRPEAGLRIGPADLERHRTPRTRLLVFNSPNNPTGEVYSDIEVAAIVEWCLRHDVLILSDEIYNRLVFDRLAARSPASLGAAAAAATLTVNGVSKSHAMTGWRIGFLTGPSSLMNAVVKFQGQTTGNPAAVSQAAALAALRSPDEAVVRMRAAYERRRDLAVEELATIPGLELETPHGAFYAFPRARAAVRACGGSVPLAEALVERGVAVVPGEGFGADDHFRISFALGDDRLREGLRRLRGGLAAIADGSAPNRS